MPRLSATSCSIQRLHAPALRREEAELVAAVQVVVVQEACQRDGRVVDRVFAAHALGIFGVAQKAAQVDADERSAYQAEYRKRAEATANGRLAKEACAPAFIMGALLQVAAGIGDGDQVRGNFLGFQVHLKVIKHSVEYAAHLDGAARFAGNEHERAFQIEACKNRAHANGRYGVEHFEVERVAVDFVVFGDGHGILSGAALANKQNGFKAFGDDAF